MELRDELGHALLTLKFFLGAIAGKFPLEQEYFEHSLQEQLDYISNAIEKVRRPYHDLSPEEKEGMGLSAMEERLYIAIGSLEIWILKGKAPV